MLKKIEAVKYKGGHTLWLRFNDGQQGEVDFAKENWKGYLFEPLRNKQFFRYYAINDAGGLEWLNGADMCPDVLYEKVTGQFPAYVSEARHDH
jgi:hypothetical protein